MKLILSLSLCALIASCNFKKSNGSNENLKDWIIANEQKLTADSDSLIQDYLIRSIMDSGWTSASLLVDNDQQNSLGTLARKAGKSANCIKTELTFFNDPNRKKEVRLITEDSACVDMLKTLQLPDSTGNFIYGTSFIK